MSIKLILKMLGFVLLILSAAMSLSALWGAYALARGAPADSIVMGEREGLYALLETMLIGGAAGGVMILISRGGRQDLRRREALVMVAMSWVIGGGLAAVPFFFWAQTCTAPGAATHPFREFVNCYFESISGLTTTGATVLSRIETLPESLLLWRSFTHWIGGLGIIVLFVAVLPTLGVGGKRVFRIESPGPTPQGVRPRIQAAARMLWLIYLGLTAAEIILLWAFGMTFFDAVNHTFATLATGGFSTHGASAGAFQSPLIQWTIVVFMVLAGVNFGLYYLLILGRWNTVRRDRELRAYLIVMGASAIIVAALVWSHPYATMTGEMAEGTLEVAVRHAVFQVVSIQTTTGFTTADFDQWPFTCKAILLGLMFVGGCAGSTGGGIKVIRCLMTVKIVLAEFEHVFRPNVVRPVRVGKLVIDGEMKSATIVYVLVIIGLFAAGGCAIKLLEDGRGVDITTAATASAATLHNIGPGLGLVGATQHYGWFTAGSKVVMCVLMILGRLEVYTIAALFLPRFWKQD